MANISYGVNIIPKTNNAYTLGNSDYKWANIFTNKINGTDVASIIAGGEGGGEGSSIDVSDKVDKTALLDAGITASTYSTAFGGAFTVTTATDSNHTIPYAKATPTGVINKHKRFRVTINDTEYILESRIWFINNKFYNYLGDISKVYEHPEYVPGGNDSNVPFLITFDRDNNSAIEVYTTTAGTYTIKIETITDTFKKLPLELIYGSAYAPILQSDNTGSTFNGYSIGVNALVSKRGTVGIGHGNILKNDFVTALGSAHEVGGANSCAIGFNNITNSECNLGAGTYNIIESSDNYASTIGLMNHIYGHSPYSMAVGFRNTINAYSQSAHAFGYWNINDGENSTSLGYSNSAFSDCTLAMGAATTASGKCQITLGTLNVIDATTSWVASTSYEVGDKVYINNRWYKCITANSDATFTSSKWTRCRSKFLEILGNGDIDASPVTRSNARATDWDGNAYIKGNLYIGCNADSSGGTRVPHDIQVNGTSIVSDGVATIPMAATYVDANTQGNPGLVLPSSWYGTKIQDGVLAIAGATEADVKTGTTTLRPLTPLLSKNIVFYGLAKAAGDSTQSASSNSIGTYTADAKSAIQSMLAVAPTASPIFTGTFSLNRAANSTIGINSVSIGESCTASGEDSFAEGRYTTASGYYSHAEGNYTTTLGMASHAEGTVTIANHASQHVFGEYNVEDNSDAANYLRGNFVEIVGNGTASNAQSNARALDWSGNEYLKGDLYINCNASSGNGTKVICATDYATANDFGIVKKGSGLYITDGVIGVNTSSDTNVKEGTAGTFTPVSKQHAAAFYGLAKAAGDTTQAASSNSVGYYTDTAKAKIQQMLGIQTQAWELIKEDTFTNATEADHVITTDSNGDALALTDVFFMFETPKDVDNAASFGTYGQIHFYYDTNTLLASESGSWTQAANSAAHGTMVWITQELGGLFVCRYTSSTTNSNGAQWKTRYGAGFTVSSQGARFFNTTKIISKIKIPTVTGTGHYILYGKRPITI